MVNLPSTVEQTPEVVMRNMAIWILLNNICEQTFCCPPNQRLMIGEEEKSEKEPMKIWGNQAKGINITATCIRVPLEDGHMASVAVSFTKKPTPSQIKNAWKNFNPLKSLKLPSSPKNFITYFEEEDRPQTRIDRDLGNGMGISVGRLREDNVFDYQFVGLSHNTIRGAAGGAILTAELLKAKGYLDGKN